MNIIFLNGQFVDKESAQISVFDRGFLFGDALYEVLPIINGAAHAAELHLQRLISGMESIHISNPYSINQWKQILASLISRNDPEIDLVGHHIYLQISRGTEPTRMHRLPKGLKPTVVAFIQKSKKPSEKSINAGLTAITISDPRRHDCSLKSTSLIANILALHAALEGNAIEAIFIDKDNYALEGTQSNLFTVIHQCVVTPPLSQRILGGVTRELIINSLLKNEIPVEERKISKQELLAADEIWLTGSIKGIYPIVMLDGQTIGDGTPGSLWKKACFFLKEFEIKP
jgi:D-alanine transaminase